VQHLPQSISKPPTYQENVDRQKQVALKSVDAIIFTEFGGIAVLLLRPGQFAVGCQLLETILGVRKMISVSGHKKTYIVSIRVLVLLLVFCAGCQILTPAGSGTTRFDYRQIKLKNGLDVVTLEDFSCPIVAVQLWYHVGSKNEQPDRQGFAHMFEHMMFRGTDRLGPTDHFADIRRVGGTSNGSTGFDRTVYVETLPAEQLQLALWLEAERMTFLKIDQKFFDTERKVVEEERRMGMNKPYGTLFEDVFKNLFKVHPYRWTPIGKIAHLRATSVQELRNFWKKYYVPSNATLLIVGAVTHEEAQKQAKRYFGWIPRYDKPPAVTIREPMPDKERFVTIKQDNAPAPGVGVVYRTVPIADKDATVLELMAEILGGGNSSRLYRELVADKQLAVNVAAESFELEQAGLFGAGALMASVGADSDRVLAIIKKQIETMRTKPVTAHELTKARNQKLRELVTENLRIESKARALGEAAVVMGDVSQVNRQLQDVRRVTAGDILRVAKRYLTPNRALDIKVKRSLAGAVSGSSRAVAEDWAPVTAEPEKVAPKPGRGNLIRPKDFPRQAPFAQVVPHKMTPRYESRRLANGLKVIVVPNHEVPFVTARLGLLAGAWTEEKPGTASMATKMLVKGTDKHTEGELADELDTYAISLSGSADMDTGSINMGCLTEHVDRAVGLMAEVAMRPTFPAAEFEKLRKQVVTSLAVESAEPSYIANRQFRRRLYGKHFYARTATGEVADVNALAVEDLKRWWNRFAGPDDAVLIFAGDIETDRALELAQKAFGSWKPVGELPQPKLPGTAANSTHIYLVDRPGSSQSQIRIGQRGITRHDKGYFVSRIVSNYFGWGFNSRLNEKVRVEKGLTYSVWGGYFADRFAGKFEVSTFSKTESTAQAVRAVLDEIQRLKTQKPTEQEIRNGSSYMLGSFVRQRETSQQVAGDMWLIESQGLGNDYLERLLAGVAKTNAADCERLTARTIEPDKLVVVVVGQADKLKEELEKIAPVTVVERNAGN